MSSKWRVKLYDVMRLLTDMEEEFAGLKAENERLRDALAPNSRPIPPQKAESRHINTQSRGENAQGGDK